jgi:lysophospholipase L1-like esterase
LFPHYESEVFLLERKRAALGNPTDIVTFYGSSSIRLWDSLEEDFPDVTLVNLGFGGSTLAACAYYFERLVLPYKPRSIICYAGENDIGDGIKSDVVVQSFHKLHHKVATQLEGVPFAYLSIKPSPGRWQYIDRIREVNRRIEAEMSHRAESHFLDIYTPMLRDDGKPRRELWSDDGIHLNSLGYHVWWQVIASQRRKLGF